MTRRQKNRALARGSSYVARAGFVEGLELFDAAFFDMAPAEAAAAAPEQRLCLEHCAAALRGARRGGAAGGGGGDVAVYVGVANSDWRLAAEVRARENGSPSLLSSERVPSSLADPPPGPARR